MTSVMSVGNFDWIQDTHSKEMLQETYRAIVSVPGGPETIRDLPSDSSFMFTYRTGPIWDQIHAALTTGHSGFSYAWVMQNMRSIFCNYTEDRGAESGWNTWVGLFNKSNEEFGQADDKNGPDFNKNVT
jgi:hypothetical protein